MASVPSDEIQPKLGSAADETLAQRQRRRQEREQSLQTWAEIADQGNEHVKKLLKDDVTALYRMHSTIFEATFGETRESFMSRFARRDHARHYWFLGVCKLQLGRALLFRSQTRSEKVTKKKKRLRKILRTNPAPPAKPSRLRESWTPSEIPDENVPSTKSRHPLPNCRPVRKSSAAD